MDDSRTLGAIAAVLLATSTIGGCATYIGTTAQSFLNRVEHDPDPNIRYRAYAKLANPNCYDDDAQKAEAVRILARRLRGEREPVVSRAVICHTLGELGRPEARTALLRALDDPEPAVRAEACRALGKVGRPEDSRPLARLMAADNQIDGRIAAIEGIGLMKVADPDIATVLVDGMEDRDPAIRLASYDSIRAISGQDFGPDPKAWRKYAESLRKVEAPGSEKPPGIGRGS